MILIDASALIAICDRGQGKDHVRFVSAVSEIRDELITTLPCVTEAMYFMRKFIGWHGQEILWRFLVSEAIEIFPLTARDLHRMQTLMKKYADTPMDFADASLVAAAETLKSSRIITSDKDFQVYRINGRTKFEIIP
jgi:uncharacterized protein